MEARLQHGILVFAVVALALLFAVFATSTEAVASSGSRHVNDDDEASTHRSTDDTVWFNSNNAIQKGVMEMETSEVESSTNPIEMYTYKGFDDQTQIHDTPKDYLLLPSEHFAGPTMPPESYPPPIRPHHPPTPPPTPVAPSPQPPPVVPPPPPVIPPPTPSISLRVHGLSLLLTAGLFLCVTSI